MSCFLSLRRRSIFCCLAVAAGLVLAGAGAPIWAETIVVDFDGGGDGTNWADANNWDPNTEPDNGVDTFDARIDAGGAFSVRLNAIRTVDSLKIGSDDSLTLLNSFDLTLANTAGNPSAGTVTNDGTITMSASLSSTDLTFQGAGSFAGTGTLVMGDSFNNRVRASSTVVTNGPTHTIRGAGQLLANSGGMINQGTIIAEGTNEMRIDPSGLGFTNQGAMTAAGAGGFDLQSGTFTNTGQTINVQAGSKLDLNAGVNLIGGTVQTSGSGRVNILGSGTNLTLDAVTLQGTVTQPNSFDAYVVHGVTNDATWNLNSSLSSTDVTFSGDTALGGTGQIVMSDSAYNRLLSNGSTLTHVAGHTIRGAGQLLANSGGMINQGTIIAEGANEMRIDPSGLGFTNQGTMTAAGAGGFDFQSGTFTNTGRTIHVQPGSKLDLNGGVTLIGGTVQNSGSGRVNILGSGTNLTLDAVTLQGTVNQANSYDARVINGVTNDAVWNLNSSLSSTDVTFSGDTTLGGTGQIVMSDSAQNRLLSNGSTLTHLAGHTIRGAGQLLANSGGMINQGTIIAEGANETRIDPSVLGFTNQGTMTAAGAGGFDFYSGTFTNTGQTIHVQHGSKLDLNAGVTLIGGTVQTSGSGRVNILGSGTNLTLDAVTLQGTVNQANNYDARVVNGITNDATWNLNSSLSVTDITFSGNTTLGGTGQIVMSDSAYNRLLSNASTLTHLAGHTIRGAGRLLNNSGGMINQGTLIAEGAREMQIDPSGLGFINQGIMTAKGAGGFAIADGSGTSFSTSGDVLVEAGSRLDVSGPTGVYTQTGGRTIVDGTLTAATRVDVTGGLLGGRGNVAADVFNLAGGTVGAGASCGELDITGDYTQDAMGALAVEIDGYAQGVQYDLLGVSGAATLDGRVDVIVDLDFALGALEVGDTFQILRAGGGVAGGFSSINVNLTGLEFEQLIGPSDVTLRVTRNDVVPEPGTLTLLALGLAVLAIRRRRRSGRESK